MQISSDEFVGVDVLAAYRDDLTRRGDSAASEVEGAWVELGILLAHAGVLPQEERDAALSAAGTLVRALLGASAWEEGHRLDPMPPKDADSLPSRVRTVSEMVEDAGAMRLADAILAAFLTAHPDCDPLERGRIEAARARIAWKEGSIDAARDRLAHVIALSKRIESDELLARALIGQALLARLAGNYPESHDKARSALELAMDGGMRRLAAVAHNTLLVVAAVRGRYGDAIAHGWNGFLLAQGDSVLESELLGNVGQVFLDLGHPITAIAAFRAVVGRQPHSRLLLPALGGYAVAAARLGDEPAMQQAAAGIAYHVDTAGTPYAIAVALLELADAYDIVGRRALARAHRSHARRIADAKAYHELVFRADQPRDMERPASRALDPTSESIAEAVRELVGA